MIGTLLALLADFIGTQATGELPASNGLLDGAYWRALEPSRRYLVLPIITVVWYLATACLLRATHPKSVLLALKRPFLAAGI